MNTLTRVLLVARPAPYHVRSLLTWTATTVLLLGSAVSFSVFSGSLVDDAGPIDAVAPVASFAWVLSLLAGASVVGLKVRAGLLTQLFLVEPARPLVVSVRICGGAIAGATVGLTSIALTVAGRTFAAFQEFPVLPVGPNTTAALTLVCMAAGAVGAALGWALLDHTATVLAALAYFLVVEALLAGLAGPTVAQYLPGEAARAIVMSATVGHVPEFGVAIIWPALLAVVTAVAFQRTNRCTLT